MAKSAHLEQQAEGTVSQTETRASIRGGLEPRKSQEQADKSPELGTHSNQDALITDTIAATTEILFFAAFRDHLPSYAPISHGNGKVIRC